MKVEFVNEMACEARKVVAALCHGLGGYLERGRRSAPSDVASAHGPLAD